MYLFIYKVFKYIITLQSRKIAKNCAYQINVALKLVLLLDSRFKKFIVVHTAKHERLRRAMKFFLCENLKCK